MTIIKDEKLYQLEQNPHGKRWTAVTYPDTFSKTEEVYNEYVKSYPHIQFRIVEIHTVETVVK